MSAQRLGPEPALQCPEAERERAGSGRPGPQAHVPDPQDYQGGPLPGDFRRALRDLQGREGHFRVASIELLLAGESGEVKSQAGAGTAHDA